VGLLCDVCVCLCLVCFVRTDYQTSTLLKLVSTSTGDRVCFSSQLCQHYQPNLSLCLCVSLSLCLCFSLSLCLCVFISLSLSVCFSLFLSVFSLPPSLSVLFSLSLCLCVSLSLSVC